MTRRVAGTAYVLLIATGLFAADLRRSLTATSRPPKSSCRPKQQTRRVIQRAGGQKMAANAAIATIDSTKLAARRDQH